MLSSSGSLSEHQPGQWLQTLQFYSIQDCGREYSRINIKWNNGPDLCLVSCADPVLLQIKGLVTQSWMRTPQHGRSQWYWYGVHFHVTMLVIKTLYNDSLTNHLCIWWLVKWPSCFDSTRRRANHSTWHRNKDVSLTTVMTSSYHPGTTSITSLYTEESDQSVVQLRLPSPD